MTDFTNPFGPAGPAGPETPETPTRPDELGDARDASQPDPAGERDASRPAAGETAPLDRDGSAVAIYQDPTRQDVAVRDPQLDTGEHAAPPCLHHLPILASGSADPCVQDLGRMLGDVGYENTVSRGENPYGHVDQSVMAAVYAFRSANGVEEDSSGFGGDHPAAHSLANAHIGWRTWASLRDAHQQLAAR